MDTIMNISRVSSFTIALLGFLAHGGAAVWASTPELQGADPVDQENFPPSEDITYAPSDVSVELYSDGPGNMVSPRPDSTPEEKKPHPDKDDHNCDPQCSPPYVRYEAFLQEMDKLRSTAAKLSKKVTKLHQAIKPMRGIPGQVQTLAAAMLTAEQNIGTANNNYNVLSEQHDTDVSELTTVIRKHKKETNEKIQSVENKFTRTLQEQLKKSADQQMTVTKETLSDVSGDLSTIKRILGAYENMPSDVVPDVNLTENNLARLRERVETEKRRIDALEKQLGPVEDLANHQVFLDLAGEALPTEPLTVARMLTELANAYIQFRDDLPRDAQQLIETKFSEIDKVLEPLTKRIDTNETEIGTLKGLLGAISGEDLKKVEQLETLIAENIKKELTENIGKTISQLCMVFVRTELQNMSEKHEDRLTACETELISQKATDQDLDQRVRDQAQQLKDLENLIKKEGGLPSTDLDALSSQVSKLESDLSAVSNKLPENLITRLETAEKADEKIDALRDELVSKLWGEDASELSPSITELAEQLSAIQENYDPEEITSLKKLLEEFTGSDASSSLAAISDLTQRVQALEDADLTNRLTTIEEKDYDAQLEALRDELKNALVSSSAEAVEALKIRVKTLEDGNYPQRISNLASEIDGIRGSLPENLKSRLENLERIDVDGKIQANNETFKDSLMAEIEGLFTTKLEPLNTSISNLKGQIDAAEETLNGLNVDQKISDLRTELEGKIASGGSGSYPTLEAFGALSDRVTAVEKACSAEQLARISELLEKISGSGNIEALGGFDSRLQTVEAKVANLDVQALMDKDTEQDERLTKLETQFKEQSEALSAALKEIEGTLSNFEEFATTQTTELQGLSARVGKNEQDIGNLVTRVNALASSGGGSNGNEDFDFGDTSTRT